MKQKLQNFTQSASKIVYSEIYLAAIVLIVFLCWFFEKEAIGLVIAILIGAIVLLVDANLFTIAPLIMLVPLVIPTNQNSAEYLPLYFALIPLVIAFIAHFIIYRPKFKIGKLFAPQTAVSIALIVGGCTVATGAAYMRAFPMILALGVGMLLLYFLYSCYASSDKQRDFGLYFAKTLIWLGILVCLEVFGCILKHGGFTAALDGTFELGWGGRNNISVLLLLSAPMCFYMTSKYKSGWLYALLGVAQYVVIVFTMSRAGILGMALTAPFVIIYALKKTINRKATYLAAGVALLAIVIAMCALHNQLTAVIERLIQKGASMSGRDDLWKEALNLFAANPFFGAGMFHDGPNFKIGAMGLYWFHNTFLQIIGSMGLLGLGAFICLYVVRYKLILKDAHINPRKVFIFLAMLGFEIQSMLDTATFSPIPFMMCVTLLTLICENDKNNFNGEVDNYNRFFKLSRLFPQKTPLLDKCSVTVTLAPDDK